MKKIFCILVCLLFASSLVLAATEFSPSSQTNCHDGICSTTLYSGTRFVYEDEQWKKVEEARSLKDVFDVVITYGKEADDPKNVIVEDFNYTSIKFKEIETSSLKAGAKPLTIKVLTPTTDEQGQKELIEKKQEQIDLKGADKLTNLKVDWSFGDEIHLGESSTTIQLQDADTENMDDADLTWNSDGDYGTSINLFGLKYPLGGRSSILRFNITAFNQFSVLSSDICLYLKSNGLDDATEGFNLTAYLVYNNFTVDGLEWVEGNDNSGSSATNGEINGLERPVVGYDTPTMGESSYNFSGDTSLGWVCWDTTIMVNYSVLTKQNNISILLEAENEYGTPIATDYVTFDSKESATTNQRPYLNITYTDPTPPTFDEIPHNRTLEYLIDHLSVQVNATDNGVIDQYNLNDTANFKISSSGILENNTALAIGVYYLNISVNDTANNQNSTIINLNVTDSLIPTWTLIPANASILTTGSISEQFTAEDINGIDSYWIDNFIFNISNTGLLQNNITLSAGTYLINVYANDTLGNIASVYYQVDVTTPPPEPAITGQVGSFLRTSLILIIGVTLFAVVAGFIGLMPTPMTFVIIIIITILSMIMINFIQNLT